MSGMSGLIKWTKDPYDFGMGLESGTDQVLALVVSPARQNIEQDINEPVQKAAVQTLSRQMANRANKFTLRSGRTIRYQCSL